MSGSQFNFFSVGLNYETSSVKERERISFGAHEIEEALADLIKRPGVSEAVILSTCNRTEIYGFSVDKKSLIDWLVSNRSATIEQISGSLYDHRNEQVAKHVFRVASGLDSMVLGETQILGQLKDAVRSADNVGALGFNLRKLFDAGFAVAKLVRTDTDVGGHSISLAAASAKVSNRIFGSLNELSILFVGAGDMNRVCAEHFRSLKVKNITVANRTLERAKSLSISLGGDSISLSEVTHRLLDFDIVVSCTGSPTPIIGKRSIEKAIEARRHRPILLFDLAVPRDIELEASDLEDAFLYTIDDLGEIVKDGMRNREEAARDAETIIDDRLIQFKSQLDRETIIPIIKKFRQRGESIMQTELEKALSLIAKGEAPERVVRTLSRAISNKFMDEPSRALSNVTQYEKFTLAEALKRLYGVDKN